MGQSTLSTCKSCDGKSLSRKWFDVERKSVYVRIDTYSSLESLPDNSFLPESFYL